MLAVKITYPSQGRRDPREEGLSHCISAYRANDAEREEAFVNRMKNLLMPEDVVILISVHGGTGFSNDLVRAARYARDIGAATIALVGFDGGPLHRESTCSILVPVLSTPQTEGMHLVIEHLLMHILQRYLSDKQYE